MNAKRENEGLLLHDFKDLCNSSEVAKIYCDGLKFTLCIVPEWCSSKQLTYSALDTLQTDHETANVLQNMLLSPGPGTAMQTKQPIFPPEKPIIVKSVQKGSGNAVTHRPISLYISGTRARWRL